MGEQRICQVCGRQIVSSNISDSYTAPQKGAVKLVNGACCGDCAKELDKDGRFKGEL